MMANLPPPRPKRKADHPLQQKTSDSVVPIQASKVCSSASSCLLPACSPWDDRSMHPMLMNYSSADTIYTPDYYPVLPEVKGDTGFTGVGTLNYQNNGWTGSSSRPWQTYEVPTGSSSRPWQTYEVPKLADSHASYSGDTGLAGVRTLNYQNNGWTGNSSRPWQTYDVPKLADSHASYPVIPNFTEVYNFIATMFDPFAKCPLEHFLQKLKEMDPITAKTVLLLVKNLTINMSSPHFEPLGTWLSTYDGNTNRPVAAFHAHQIHSMPSQGFYLLPPPS